MNFIEIYLETICPTMKNLVKTPDQLEQQNLIGKEFHRSINDIMSNRGKKIKEPKE